MHLKKLLALGLSLTMAVALLSGCGQQETDVYKRQGESRSAVDHDSAVDPAALDHDNYVGAAATGETVDTPEAALINRDGLMVSAMLVDIAPEGETFPAFNTAPTYVEKTILAKDGAWMGGGLENLDLVELKPTDVSYKIVARGWMDLCNPGAGYDSASAQNKVKLVEGKYYDYTLYLQPNLYEVEACLLYTSRVKIYVTDDADGQAQLKGYLAGIDLPYTTAALREYDWAHSWQKY